MTAPAPPSTMRAWQKARTSSRCISQWRTLFFSTGRRFIRAVALAVDDAHAAPVFEIAAVEEGGQRDARFVAGVAVQVEFAASDPADRAAVF